MDRYVMSRFWARLRATPTRARGQSIPLIALMLVLLFGMVALSVDVGNTYSQQRQVERAANAAAVYGMQRYMSAQARDEDVFNAIVESFRSNGIDVVTDTDSLTPSTRLLEAHYRDIHGNRYENCEVGECGGEVPNAYYLEVDVRGEVETNFARLLGQETLPVSTLSFAGRCPPINGMMPFAVRHGVINGTRSPAEFWPLEQTGRMVFNDLPNDPIYGYRRFYFGTPNQPDVDIGMVRWRDRYDASDFGDMLTGEGTLKLGFEEFQDWPVVNGEINLSEPANYPPEPFYLQEGDWVRGLRDEVDIDHPGTTAPYTVDLSQYADILDRHIENRTKLIVPLYNYAIPATDPGVDARNPAYYIGQFGEFYLLDYDDEHFQWIEMAFVDYAPRIPCPAENVEVPATFGVRGDISLLPRYADVPDEWKPAAFTVMLDVSGSMNWDFRGFGSYQGISYQCESKYAEFPGVDYWPEEKPDGNDDSCSWNGRWEHPVTGIAERRAYASRQALREIIETMQPTERIRFVAFNNPVREVSPQWYDPNDPNLIHEVMTVGQVGNPATPSFITGGGTNGAAALQRAFEVMTANDFPEEIPRRPVAIYMTDGVSNQRVQNQWNTVPGGTKTNHACDGMPGSAATNTAWCQIGYHDGKPRPIQQMMLTSTYMHQEMIDQRGYDDFTLYVVAMGRLDTTGLDEVSTDPSGTYSASDAEDLEQLLADIQQEVQSGACLVRGGAAVQWIDAASAPNPSFTGDAEVFGFIDIEENGAIVKQDVPVFNNPETGRLGFNIDPSDGLPPGTYQLTNPRVYYRPPGEFAAVDGELYNRIRLDADYVSSLSFTITPENELGDVALAPEMVLDINQGRMDMLCEGVQP